MDHETQIRMLRLKQVEAKRRLRALASIQNRYFTVEETTGMARREHAKQHNVPPIAPMIPETYGARCAAAIEVKVYSSGIAPAEVV